MNALMNLSEQDRGYTGLLKDVIERVNKLGELSAKDRAAFANAGREIANLKSAMDRMNGLHASRFEQLANQYAGGGNGAHRGVFPTREAARQFGLLVAAKYAEPEERAVFRSELEKAGIAPSPGAAGGYLIPELLVPGIVANVEKAGVFERNCRPLPVTVTSGGIAKRTAGPTVYFPDSGVGTTPSDMTFGRGSFNLKRWSVLTLVDRWMMVSDLAVALGEYVAREIGYAIGLKEDECFFMGDGTSGVAGYTGLLYDESIVSYTPTDAYDTFQKVIDVSTKCLGALLGALPAYVTQSPDAKWYMHASIFFGLLSVRDTGGMPIVSLYTSGEKWPLALMGYPVEFVQGMPAVGGSGDGASKPMLLFSDLNQACRFLRHRDGMELASSEHVKFAEGQVAIKGEAYQDRVVVDPNAVGRLITHS